MVVCEAGAAHCLYRSACAKTGDLVNVTGALPLSWLDLPVARAIPSDGISLKNHVSVFASCPDWMSAKLQDFMPTRLEMILRLFPVNPALYRLALFTLRFMMQMQQTLKKPFTWMRIPTSL